MNIEDYFINLSWICVDTIDKETLFEILDVNIDKSVKWEEGCELIMNSFDEKTFLNFKIDNWDIIVGKYFFTDSDFLKEAMNELSQNSQGANSFAIDVWSSFYCYSKSVNGNIIRFWNENDNELIDEGNITKEEFGISEGETANRLLELANQTTIQFELIEDFLSKNEIQILK